MTGKQASQDRFLEAAYRLYAESGRKGLSLKQLSLQSRLSRGKCAYLSPNRAQLVEALLQKHRQKILQLGQKIRDCPAYIPDLFQLLTQYPTVLRFHRQLLLEQKEEETARIYRKLNGIINAVIYPLWAAHVDFKGNPEDGQNLHLTLTDIWLLYLDPDDLSSDALIHNAERLVRRLMWLRNGEGIFDTIV